MKIANIHAHEIIDSRGYPTVETIVEVEGGHYGLASVPSGASTGTHEAVELRDGDKTRFLGKGVLKAVAHVNEAIAHALKGKDIANQEEIDHTMITLDGTENKANLGANAILSVSEACLKAAASAANLPLYRYIMDIYKLVNNNQLSLPQPTFNVVNGGKHGNGKLEFQEFHILPRTNQAFVEMMRMGDEVYLTLQKLLKDAGLFQGLGDEGGFTGNFQNNKEVLDWLIKAIEATGYKPYFDVSVGLDLAASEFFDQGTYHIADKNQALTADEMIQYIKELNEQYHFAYLEDPLHEGDWDHWATLTYKLADSPTPIIGDDFLTTNPKWVNQAILGKNCNAVLVKPNQIGTVTEVIEVVRAAKAADWTIVLSHRSGETNDTFVSDFAVGVGADIVKFGAPARGERVAKYNRLMEIEREIGK